MSQSHPPIEELFAYRDGELDAERRGLIEAHVLSCTACQARIDALSDAEGSLREQSGEPDGAYLDRLTESVMARVAKEPAPGGAAAARRPQRVGRRRNFEDEPRGRAPGLPWPAIASTVAAAAAVVVVVALLFQRPQQPAPTIARAPSPAESDGGRGESPAPGEASGDVAGEAAPDGRADGTAEPGAAESGAAATPPSSESPLLAKSDVEKGGAPREPLAATAADQVRTQNAAEALPEVAARRVAREKEAADAPAKITGGLDAPRQESAREAEGSASAAAGPTYDQVVARYGLPPLYDPLRVRREALLDAEPDLRFLYRMGGAAADSARVRIYLAEAARLRAGEDLDAETYDEIAHHYRRAIRLAPDPATATVARQRLEDFVARSAPRR